MFSIAGETLIQNIPKTLLQPASALKKLRMLAIRMCKIACVLFLAFNDLSKQGFDKALVQITVSSPYLLIGVATFSLLPRQFTSWEGHERGSSRLLMWLLLCSAIFHK
eukprot:183975-Pelagomonas_calceolata.AAC.3